MLGLYSGPLLSTDVAVKETALILPCFFDGAVCLPYPPPVLTGTEGGRDVGLECGQPRWVTRRRGQHSFGYSVAEGIPRRKHGDLCDLNSCVVVSWLLPYFAQLLLWQDERHEPDDIC